MLRLMHRANIERMITLHNSNGGLQQCGGRRFSGYVPHLSERCFRFDTWTFLLLIIASFRVVASIRLVSADITCNPVRASGRTIRTGCDKRDQIRMFRIRSLGQCVSSLPSFLLCWSYRLPAAVDFVSTPLCGRRCRAP